MRRWRYQSGSAPKRHRRPPPLPWLPVVSREGWHLLREIEPWRHHPTATGPRETTPATTNYPTSFDCPATTLTTDPATFDLCTTTLPSSGSATQYLGPSTTTTTGTTTDDHCETTSAMSYTATARISATTCPSTLPTTSNLCPPTLPTKSAATNPLFQYSNTERKRKLKQ